MKNNLLRDALLWGFLLWLMGYLLGIVAFTLVPKEMIGWVITPVATLITLWVLKKKVKGKTWGYYIKVGVVWMALAISLDYLFIVKMLQTGASYYKPDVYLYYFLSITLPILMGWYETKNKNNS